jgi:hypothetical protein
MTSIPTPIKATGSHFYKYSSAAHLEWLKVMMLEHELYLPSLTELNDPRDGRPKLAPLSEEQMVSFLHTAWCNDHPHASYAARMREKAIIRYNVYLYGCAKLMRGLSNILNKELKDYRIYSMSKRYDNLALWAKYAADHSGYCLEFANEDPLFEHTLQVIYGESVQMDVTDPAHRSGYWFFCKRQEWSNEEEVRLVSIRGQSPKVKIKPPWLKRIILGWRMSADNQSMIREWAKQRVPELIVVNAYYDEADQIIKLGDLATATAS